MKEYKELKCIEYTTSMKYQCPYKQTSYKGNDDFLKNGCLINSHHCAIICKYNKGNFKRNNQYYIKCSYEYENQKGKVKKVEEIKTFKPTEEVLQSMKEKIKNGQFNQSFKYDNGKLRWSLLLWDIVEHIVRTMNIGAIKYNPNSYKKVEPYKERYSDALMRHFRDFQKGIVIDKDTGTPILAYI